MRQILHCISPGTKKHSSNHSLSGGFLISRFYGHRCDITFFYSRQVTVYLKTNVAIAKSTQWWSAYHARVLSTVQRASVIGRIAYWRRSLKTDSQSAQGRGASAGRGSGSDPWCAWTRTVGTRQQTPVLIKVRLKEMKTTLLRNPSVLYQKHVPRNTFCFFMLENVV